MEKITASITQILNKLDKLPLENTERLTWMDELREAMRYLKVALTETSRNNQTTGSKYTTGNDGYPGTSATVRWSVR